MKKAAMVFGVISALLGGLWLLQGLGIVHLRPILCFADCAAIQGSSLAWAVIGAIALAVGGIVIFWALKLPGHAKPLVSPEGLDG
jgi:hypothetical protein